MTGVAIVFHGAAGAGKGTVWDVLVAIFGSANCTVLGQDDIESKFNASLRWKMLVNLNEVISSSNRSAETANRLKPWITDAMIRLEDKFLSKEDFANCANLLFNSNGDQPVIIDDDDRRYSVKKSMHALDKHVADRVYKDLHGPRTQLGGFFHHLLRRRHHFTVGKLLATEDRAKIQAAGATSDVKFLRAIAADGLDMVAGPWKDDVRYGQPSREASHGGLVASEELQDIYQHYCKRNGLRPRDGQKLLEGVEKYIPGARKLPNPRQIGGVKRRGFGGIPIHSRNDQSVKDEKVVSLTPGRGVAPAPIDNPDYAA
jgi:hypothetical protein